MYFHWKKCYLCDINDLNIMKELGLRKWSTVVFVILSTIILAVSYSIYYRKAKHDVLLDVQSCVMELLQKEMTVRADSVIKHIHVVGSGSLSRDDSGIVTFTTRHGKERFEIDIVSDEKNIAHNPILRIGHSISLKEHPFLVDSFRMECEKMLARQGIYVHLFFDFRNGDMHVVAGDSLSTQPLMDCNMGNGNEYTLKANVCIPFLFRWNVRIYLVLLVIFVICGVSFCYWKWRKTGKVNSACNKKETVENKVRYICSTRTFYLLDAEHTVCLTVREAEIFETLYFAYEHTMSSGDLKMKLFGDSLTSTSSLSTRLSDVRRKLEEVGGLAIDYNKTTRCYALVLPCDGVEVINLHD